ncbi:DNA-3-methyladenine glycosylase II [Rhodobium orientis]|uniref:DNA-3-methyladenine glycosylase II n=1 Tax=Rhodobium orientis TaxID=34017 RepID=A0A327JTM2_9HYPH|nr:DNA-3-methyladenine glycosylase [Rhodobium orientis]MBB4304328.1 DNA-3-methyladenine glycosylase II [Rhodobium orientis]MBK5948178.1 DNA-3-methyladenine glycosidase [Rhodobium orientis]RAI28824.1 DNA-3-methyladenine glycosidase [Rhodobium orientis]
MRRIETEADIAEGLSHIARTDPRLVPIIEAAGGVPLRRRHGGLDGLCEIVVAQQLSKASADAIFRRLEAALTPFTADGLLAIEETDLRACGLSAPKIRTLRAIAEAASGGHLALEALGELPQEEAIAVLTAIRGIGPWTAEVYLMFCAGHPDIFPAGDLALQVAVGEAFGLEGRPKPKAVAEMAESWAPWRSVASRLFWSYYSVCRKGRDVMPI